MRIPRIYTSSDLGIHQIVSLESKAHKHLRDVLRMKAGDSVILFNGDGQDYTGTIKELSKKTLLVDINDSRNAENESPLALHLLQPLCSSEKMDLCLQKATELGVHEITPFLSSRVNINLSGNRLDKKLKHWHSVIQSACEQSGRATLPTLHKPVPYSDAINQQKNVEVKLIASPTSEIKHQEAVNKYMSCVCAIGPEGGFTEQEITHAIELDYQAVQIGPRILRLETAVISVITLCQYHYGDF